MSITETGCRSCNRPCETSLPTWESAEGGCLFPPLEGGDPFRCMGLQRFAAAREAGIGHEIFLRVESLFPLLRHDPPRGPVRQYFETLLIVHDVSEHDLLQHLLVH